MTGLTVKPYIFHVPKVLGFSLATWHVLYLDQGFKTTGATMVDTVDIDRRLLSSLTKKQRSPSSDHCGYSLMRLYN